jgi:putative transposase
VYVIVFPVALSERRAKIPADLCENAPQIADGEFREDSSTTFCDEDQVRVEGVDDVSPPSDFSILWHIAISQTNAYIRHMVLRGFQFKLAPSAEQESLFRQFSGVCRAVYNAALYQREHFWRQFKRETGKSISYVSQAAELTKLRAEFDWIAAVSQTCEQQALRDLDKAFANFFAGRASYPTPRRKGQQESFRFQGREVEVEQLNRSWSRVRLPKIGWVRFRDTRPMRGVVKNATVSLTPIGWHISFACEFEADAPLGLAAEVGIDRGVANSIALSTGELASVPIERLRILDRKHRKAQQTANRRKRGSKRYAKARRHAAACKSKAARIRKHWNHVATTTIAANYGTVCIEALKTRNMTASAQGTIEEPGSRVAQKAGLNRSILEHGWYQFETFLSYKLAATGGELIRVDPRNTSRKCSNCGYIDARNRESQASFRCVECGHEAHADVNAALNILQAGTRPTVRARPRRESRQAA